MEAERVVRRALIVLAGALLAGCEVVALSVETGTGRVVIRLEDDGHHPRDPWRMRVRQDGRAGQVITIVPDSPVTLTVSAPLPVELTLLPPDGCWTTSPNPRTVEPAVDGTVTAGFTTRCSDPHSAGGS